MHWYQICLLILNAAMIAVIGYYAYALIKHTKEMKTTRQYLETLIKDEKGDYEVVVRCKKKGEVKNEEVSE